MLHWLREEIFAQYERGSNDRTARWQIHQDPQSRARLRKIQPIGSQELFHALQFTHFVDVTDLTHFWSFTLPWLLIACSRIRQPKETKVCSMPYGRKPADCVGRSALSTSKNSTNTCIRCARWKDVSRTPGSVAAGMAPTLEKPDRPRPSEGIPQDIDEHMRLMCDDGAGFSDRHHPCLHAQVEQRPQLSEVSPFGRRLRFTTCFHTDTEDWLKVNQFFVSQLAYLCDRMAAIQEGGGTLLDHTLLLFCSSMLTGIRRLPIASGFDGGGAAPSRAARFMTTDRPLNDKCVDSISRF